MAYSNPLGTIAEIDACYDAKKDKAERKEKTEGKLESPT
jgi:hypothetical protein